MSAAKNSFWDLLSNDMAIDLGTANTLVYIKRKGIVLNEPSVVALRTDTPTKQVLAVGIDAKKMLGKVPANIVAIRPMQEGVIADFEAAEAMLKHFIKKVRMGPSLLKPRIIIAVPVGITWVERRAVEEAAEQAGARKVFLIEEPMAAAIGAGLPVTEPRCNMVVDIGGGTADIAVISLAGVVSGKSLRIAGDKMDAAIMRYIKTKYKFIIGDGTAEDIKIAIANAMPDPQHPETMEVKGRDLVSGCPRILTVTSAEVWEAISEQIKTIIEAIKVVLEQTPPELSADIVDSGIILTGGVAQIKNLDKFISNETGVIIKVAESPLLTVAVGSGKTLDNEMLLREVMMR
ncbi:MAG: rod shape-determining protein [Desulfobacteraceae bacterium IS3]|nr:MAG: rod shape-determining protein [Desulfobacteraceae bacterium IS3]